MDSDLLLGARARNEYVALLLVMINVAHMCFVSSLLSMTWKARNTFHGRGAQMVASDLCLTQHLTLL